MIPTLKSSQISFWLRLSALVLAVCMFLWLPMEDTHIGWVLGFSIAANALFAIHYLARFTPANPALGEKHRSFIIFLRYTLTGLLAGLAVSPLALFLMVFKTGLHAHETPDFTPEQMLMVLGRFPIFGCSGLLLGIGSGVAALVNSKEYAHRV